MTEPSRFLVRRAATSPVTAAFGVFVTLHLLAALVRRHQHILFWWNDAPPLSSSSSPGSGSSRRRRSEASRQPGSPAGSSRCSPRRTVRNGPASPSRGSRSSPRSGSCSGSSRRYRFRRGLARRGPRGGAAASFPGEEFRGWGTPLNFREPTRSSPHLLRFYEGLFLVFGRGDVGILSLSAVPAALTVPAAGWLAYEAFGRRASVLAAAFAAFSSRSLALSRWGYTPATLVPLALATVAAALAARRRRSLPLAALSGAFAGLAMHTHSSALVVPVALAAWSAGTWKEPGARGRAAVAAGAALLAAGPWLIGFVQHPGYVGGRLRDVNIGNPVRDVSTRHAGPAARLVLNTIDYTGLFVFTEDPSGRHGFPERAAAPIAVGLAALVGFAVLLGRSVTDPGAPRALLWLASGSLAAGVCRTRAARRTPCGRASSSRPASWSPRGSSTESPAGWPRGSGCAPECFSSSSGPDSSSGRRSPSSRSGRSTPL
ncbi:MAG: glycosyltransferase family 39 protein [Holophagales bacterium]|nr:glycosyltransferase family 39 protein [Holophagales bacterium]